MMTPPLAVVAVFLLSMFEGCGAFVVLIPHLLGPSATKATASFSPIDTHGLVPVRKGSDSRRASSPGPSPDAIEEARKRLISSPEYQKMYSRVEAQNPFTVGEEVSAEEVDNEKSPWGVAKATIRLAVDVVIVFVPLALFVNSGVLPVATLAPLESAAAAVAASPVRPVLELLPWAGVMVLKWATEGAVALLFSPLADRLVVTPALSLVAQAKLKALSSPGKR